MPATSKQIPNVAIGEKDEKVLKAIETTQKRDIEGSARFTAGIRNGTGLVYRVVTLYGLSQAIGFADRMTKIGFVDEMPDDGRMIEGLDTTFRQSN